VARPLPEKAVPAHREPGDAGTDAAASQWLKSNVITVRPKAPTLEAW
jgi:hypothetical protein